MPNSDAACTREQAAVLTKYAERGEVLAFSVGLGSNGYPASPDAWLMLTSKRCLWVAPNGEERAS